MIPRLFSEFADATETERRVAWLRLAVVPIIVVGESLPHPNPEQTAFYVTVAVFGALAVAALARVYLGPVGQTFALSTTVVDIAALTVLAYLSGGAFSPARLAFFVVPVTVAFRFRPPLTAFAGAIVLVAYLSQALAHPSAGGPDASRQIALWASYIAWVSIAAVLLSALLERRTRRVAELASAREELSVRSQQHLALARQRLMVDSLAAEERERRALAEGLHDNAIQNLLSARHELQEAADASPHPALERADAALAESIGDLREAIFELHPYVLEEVGLEAALRAAADRVERLGGLRVHCDLAYQRRHPHEGVLYSAARQLLANAAEHSAARTVTLRLRETAGDIVLTVADDGRGFDPALLAQRVAEGHVGLASQRERIESVGGRLELRSEPGKGTDAEVHVPAHTARGTELRAAGS